MSFILFLNMFPLSANAYVLMDHKIDVGTKYIPSSNFTQTTYSHMNEAMWQWNKDAGWFGPVTITTVSNSRHNNDNDSRFGFDRPLSRNNGEFCVYKETWSGREDDVGVCLGQVELWPWPFENRLSDADILINTYHRFANSAQPGCYDTWSVFLHEMGHAVGVGHPSIFTDSVMNSLVHGTGRTVRYLYQDDIDAIKAKGY